MDFRKFFTNPFASLSIGYEKFRKFCDVHIQRIAAQNTNGKYDTMLTETTDSYILFFGTMTDEDTKFALQQSLTKSTNNIFEEFKGTVSKKEGIVKGNFGKDSAEYQEFFPNGLTEYSQATFGNVDTLINRIVTASEAHITELGQPFVDLFKDIRTRYTTARANQLKKIGEVQGSKTASGNARENLESQLFKNLLALAMEFMDNPDAGMAFFDQSILKSASVPNDGDSTTEPTITK